MQDKKYFCYEIYKNLAIWSHNGKLAYNPCSFFDGYIKTSDTFDLDEIWNGPELQHLKDLVARDLPIPGCRHCYNAELNGLTSRRQGSKKFYEIYIDDTNINQSAPQSIDYSVGNLCNLKCVICGPSNSSAWFSDYQSLYPVTDIKLTKYNKFNQLEIDDPTLLTNLKNIHFHGGGEPLLSDNHANLLKKIKEIKGLGDLHVHYNTNGTKIVDREILDLWSECRLVELYFSIDDIGERFNYQRTGASWEQVIQNIRWFKENMAPNHMFKINCTWSYLNIYFLDELVSWHQTDFCSNRLGDPVNLILQKAVGVAEVTHLSSNAKQLLIDKFNQYPMLLDIIKTIPESSEPHTEFLEFISNLDSIRHTDSNKTLTDFLLILNR